MSEEPDGEAVIRAAVERIAMMLVRSGVPSALSDRLAPSAARVFLETRLIWPTLLHNGAHGVCEVLSKMEDGR